MLQIDAHQGDVLFGLARRDITPPVGIYGRWWPRATWDRVTGVHRPLTATAVVLRDPAGRRRAATTGPEPTRRSSSPSTCASCTPREQDGAPGRRPALEPASATS